MAELLVTPAQPGSGRRGSGYRVSASTVLTAAHVVWDAARVRVRFNADRPDEWLTDGSIVWSNTTLDVAIVAIAPRPEDAVAPVGFGRVGERDAVVACSAMGFPRFKLRDDPATLLDDGSPSQYRDSMHAVGTIAVLSNRREGTLEVSVPAPERDPDPARSPWEGMSGAAVWSAGRIVGLIAEHHRADGLGTLAATRVDRWYERLPADWLGQLRSLLGLPEREHYQAIATDLADVVPVPAWELLEAGYTAQVRDIAPEVLLDREEELASLVRFCAGPESYQWWLGDAWAGKSALAAWFVLHPPLGSRVVSFFVTGRLAGQADSEAFTEAMIEQLAAVAGEPAVASATPAGRDRERRRLLERAARRADELQERLVLVVDGLDEDEGTRPGSGKPSIASLLPKRPPPSVRVLVTSRPNPDVPGDVPGDHPLRHCQPLLLNPSTYAHDVKIAAERELLQQLHGDQLQVDVISFITAAGGGLTLGELTELTKQPGWVLDGNLGSVFGRSLTTRALSHGQPREDLNRVYLFAHETLRVIAEQKLASDLGPYREGIDAWADRYRSKGWPDTTPRYLLRPYGRLLETSSTLDRLVSFVTDLGRQDRMLAYTHGDAAALSEITTAQRLLVAQPTPDLGGLGVLAVCRDRLVNRNRTLPSALPAVWARLGQVQRALELAHSIPDLKARASALVAVTEALATAGQWDRAVDCARSIPSDEWFRAMIGIAAALAATDQVRAAQLLTDAEQTAHKLDRRMKARALTMVGRSLVGIDLDRAVEVLADADLAVRAIRIRWFEDPASARLAAALILARRWSDADQTFGRITRPATQAWALQLMVEAMVALSEVDRAEQTARAIATASRVDQAPAAVALAQARAFAAVAEALADSDADRAAVLATDAERSAQTLDHPEDRDEALTSVVRAMARLGWLDHAKQIANDIEDVCTRVRALVVVASPPIPTGQGDPFSSEAGVSLAEVEQIASAIADPKTRAAALTAVAEAFISTDPSKSADLATEAERSARGIVDVRSQDDVLQAVSEALAVSGQAEPAIKTALAVHEPERRAKLLGLLLTTLTPLEADRAEALTGQIEDAIGSVSEPYWREQLLPILVESLAATGRWRRAKVTAESIDDDSSRSRAFHTLVWCLANAGRWRQAVRAAESSEAFRPLADAYARTGRWDEAERTARRLENWAQADALHTLVLHLIEAGDFDRAEATARTISRDELQVDALVRLAEAIASADRDRALVLLDMAGTVARSISDTELKSMALDTLARGLARAGALDQVERVTDDVGAIYGERSKLMARSAAMAAAGLWDQAEQAAQAADAINDPRAPRDAVHRLIQALTAAEAWERAESTILRLKATHDNDEVACALTGALAATGQWERAARIAASIVSDRFRLDAWLAVVTALAAAEPPGQAHKDDPRARASQLLADVLASEHWLTGMRGLGLVRPEALARTAEKVLHVFEA